MKFRWKAGIATASFATLVGLGTYFSSPTSPQASLTAEQQRAIKTSYRIGRYIEYLAPSIDPRIRDIYTDSIYRQSERSGIDPALIVAVIYRESSFNPVAKSSAGCVGLMQINPKAHAERVKHLSPYELYHIDNNLHVGTDILKEYMSRGGVRQGLSRYVGGSHPTYVSDVLSIYALLKLETERR